MNIQDFTPTNLFTQLNATPLPTITIVFEKEEEATKFYNYYLWDSEVKLQVLKTKTGSYMLKFIFPKNNNYPLGLEPPISENSIYEQMFNKDILITCGFALEDGKILGITPAYPLSNKISLN